MQFPLTLVIGSTGAKTRIGNDLADGHLGMGLLQRGGMRQPAAVDIGEETAQARLHHKGHIPAVHAHLTRHLFQLQMAVQIQFSSLYPLPDGPFNLCLPLFRDGRFFLGRCFRRGCRLQFIHRHGSSLISQREIGTDVETYEKALASALREHPSTIMFGEMRTRSVIEVSMRAAETGQLMLSSLHTLGAAATITRIIDTFPAEQQAQARAQLAQVLEAVISQKLVPSADGTSRVPVFEIMYSNHAIRNLIRENKPHQIDSIIQANAAEGMRTFDSDLIRLCKEGRITKDIALLNSINVETVKRQLG